MRAIAVAVACGCLGLAAEPLLGGSLAAQSPAAQTPTWCVNCDWQMGWCKVTDGGGFYYCQNVGNGCLLLFPGCGGSESKLEVTPDGSLMPLLASRDVEVESLSVTEGGLDQVEERPGVSVLRRRCDGAILQREYAPGVAVARREGTRAIAI